MRETSAGLLAPRLATPDIVERAAPTQPNLVKIPSSSRKPANIPLHTLSSSRSSTDERRDRRHSSSDSEHSELDSLWSDTGDLVDQLGDEEDPLQARLRQSQEFGASSGPHRRHPRHVHYADDSEKPGRIRKEDIEIPNVPRRLASRGDRCVQPTRRLRAASTLDADRNDTDSRTGYSPPSWPLTMAPPACTGCTGRS